MDWSRAKTIFIITFLILDIFLLAQMFIQRSESNLDLMKEISVDEQIVADNIVVSVPLPKEPTKESYVEADIKKFINDDYLQLVDQEVTINNETFVNSILQDPYPLGENWTEADVNLFVTNHIPSSGEYMFWDYNEETQTITYYQKYEDKIFYKNSDGQIKLNLNESNEIVSYTQSMLENIKEIKEQEIITAQDAMFILYNKRHLRYGYEITNVDFGYYTLVPTTTSQLLAPTWRFTINGTDDYFVNAVEGYVFQVSDEENQVLE